MLPSGNDWRAAVASSSKDPGPKPKGKQSKAPPKGKGKGKAKADSQANEDKPEPGRGGKRWTQEEKELLIEWFGQDPVNLELFKTKPVTTSEKIAQDVFHGARTGPAIIAQWDLMKAKHKECVERLEGTGEGARNLQEIQDDEDEWADVRLKWLDDQCPYFDMMDEVLGRDRSYTAPYASEAGGEEELVFMEGRRVNNPADHPPAGGSKAPMKGSLKRGVSIGTDEEKKAVKAAKKTRLEDLVEKHDARQRLDEERFEWEKQRDERYMKHQETKENNRHKEAKRRMRILELKLMKDMGLRPEDLRQDSDSD
jgi:hypothetical protein